MPANTRMLPGIRSSLPHNRASAGCTVIRTMHSRNIRLRRFVYRSFRLNGERRMSRRHCIFDLLVLFDKFSNLRCGHRAGLARYFETVSEQGHCRDRGNTETVSEGRHFFRIHFCDRRPAVSFATLRTSGATILHGPHQGAQKSTSTGTAEWLISASKARSL